MVNFNKNGAYFQTTKINFVAQIWTCFDLLLNHNHQQNYGLHFQTVLAELTTSWLQTSVFMECLLSLSWQKLSSLNPLRCFWLWASLKTCSPATPRKKSTPLSILGLIVIRSDWSIIWLCGNISSPHTILDKVSCLIFRFRAELLGWLLDLFFRVFTSLFRVGGACPPPPLAPPYGGEGSIR